MFGPLLSFCFETLNFICCFRYAYFKKLDYFSTECIYSPNAYRGHARTFLKDLEAIRPSAIIGNYFIRKTSFLTEYIINFNTHKYIILKILYIQEKPLKLKKK